MSSAETDLIAKIDQSNVVNLPSLGIYEPAIDYLLTLDPITRDKEIKEIAKGIGTTVTVLNNMVKRKISAQKKAAPIGADFVPDYTDIVEGLMAEFNSQYWFVNEGGKTYVFKQIRDVAMHRVRYDRIKVKDFKEMYMNRLTIRGKRPKTAAEVWLNHRDRRQYLDGVVFDPSGRKCLPTQFNLWQGFAVEERAGSWSKLKNHIRDIVCAGIEDHFDWFMGWMARMVQFPGEPGHTAIVMRGKQGAGKGIVAKALRRLFAQHAMAISNSKHLVGNFNLHLRDLIFLFADEAFFAGDKANVGVLNALITEDTLTIEGKGRDTYTAPNTLHVMMASNENWVVPASEDARRYAVFDPLDTKIGDEAYFNAIDAEMENGGHAAMLYELRNRDISGFNHRKVPQTSGLSDQKALSLKPVFQWWQNCLYWGSVLPPEMAAFWPEWVATNVLYNCYTDFAEKHARFERKRMDPGQFGKFLREIGLLWSRPVVAPKSEGNAATTMGPLVTPPPRAEAPAPAALTAKQIHGYHLPTLEIARAKFCEKTGMAVNWSDFDGI
jgi:hypothetical protein